VEHEAKEPRTKGGGSCEERPSRPKGQGRQGLNRMNPKRFRRTRVETS
jgi:hypothetical protein